MVIELPVNGRGVNMHIGVCGVQGLDAFRAGQQT